MGHFWLYEPLNIFHGDTHIVVSFVTNVFPRLTLHHLHFLHSNQQAELESSLFGHAQNLSFYSEAKVNDTCHHLPFNEFNKDMLKMALLMRHYLITGPKLGG